MSKEYDQTTVSGRKTFVRTMEKDKDQGDNPNRVPLSSIGRWCRSLTRDPYPTPQRDKNPTLIVNDHHLAHTYLFCCAMQVPPPNRDKELRFLKKGSYGGEQISPVSHAER